MNRGKLILVTGGARSGKSTFAERYASESGKQVVFLATAEAKDAEMRLRVEKHRLQRPRDFRTVEDPLHPERVIAGGSADNFFLIDCLTLLLNNHLLRVLEGEENPSPQKQAEVSATLLDYMDSLSEHLLNSPSDVLVVTNEVGAGIVPEHLLGRLFRDLAGKSNQIVAARADEVWFTICGIARRFK